MMFETATTAFTGWSAGLADLFLSVGVRGAVFLAVVLGITALMRSASASVRHSLLAAGVLGVLAMPVAALLPWSLPILPALPGLETSASLPQRSAPAVEPAAAMEASALLPGGSGAESSALEAASPTEAAVMRPTPSAPASSEAIPVELLLLALWTAGMVLVAGRSLAAEWKARRLIANATPVDDAEWMRLLWESSDLMEVDMDVALLRSEQSAVAFTTGAVQPLIVIPASAEEWTEDRRRAVLLHELAHIRRRDVVLHNLGRIVTVLYWFNPLVWVAAARLRSESERAADDLVLRGGTRASDYADHLLQIVTGTSAFQAPAPVLPFARKREFEGRIMAVLESERSRSSLSATRRAVVVGGVALLAIPLASLSAAPADTVDAPRLADRSVAEEGAARDLGIDSDTDVDVDADVDVQEHVDVDAGTTVDAQNGPAQRAQNAAAANLGLHEAPLDLATLLRVVPTPQAAPGLRAAYRTLAQMGIDPASDTIQDPRAVAALIELLLRDSDADVRFSAAHALGELESEDAIDALVDAMLNDPSARVRQASAWALAELESPLTVGPLLEAARDGDAEVRRFALFALGEIQDPAALSGLVGALSDPEPKVRAHAAFAIGEIEPDTAPPELVRLLADSDAEVRRFALYALGEIEDPTTADAIAGLVDDSDPEVRGTAIDILTDLDGVGVEPLLRALDDPNPEVRRRAARALGDL